MESVKKARSYAQARSVFTLDDLADYLGARRVDALCALLMASDLIYEIGEGNNPTIRVVGLN